MSKTEKNNNHIKEVGKYRMGWLIVMFDLPTDTLEERRKATRFREDLLRDGYLMLQYSVYARPAVTLDKKEACLNYLRRVNPKTGDIRCLFITDAQWMKMDIISDRIKPSRRRIDNQKDIGEQLQFWD
ncbi:MAG: CRISPR-associated endonuclease Cas2 [Candidatus Hydrogenedentes bacterium]|nr:CRISPR-associated endonuclease Cas2 [Candidatus Hydrogenedentota bacterium]